MSGSARGGSILRRGVTIAAALMFATLTLSAQAPGRWLTMKFAPLPAPEEEYWSAVANGKLYQMGGNQGGKPTRLLEYDLATDKWATKKPAPFSANHMAVAEYRGKVYVFGGAGGATGGNPNQLLDGAWEYDPAADAWKMLAPMPGKRTAAVAVSTGDRLFVIGGNDETGLTVSTNDAYDSATNRWESRRPMPTPRNHAAAGSVGGKIYVIGGRLAAANVGGMLSSATDVVEEYDPAANTWKAMTKMPYLTSGQGWTAFQGRIYVAGGELRDHHSDQVFRDVVVFDPAINDWYRLPSMPTARHGVQLAALGNRLHAIGGHLVFDGTGGEMLHTTVNEVFEFAQAPK